MTKITLRFRADKNGRAIAHYWSRAAKRWIRIGVAEAKIKLATDPRYQTWAPK